MRLAERIPLARTPTPLEFLPHLTRAWGGPDVWVKRDDLTGFGLSGNKVRKLELHLGAAVERGADLIITTGAVQSNHCRATALAAARLGCRCVLVLRTADGLAPSRIETNHRLHLLAGAEVVYVDPEEYRRRDEIMRDIADAEARAGATPWTIPEGGSDVVGMMAMAAGFEELGRDLGRVSGPIVAVWHASSSGGTTAGFGWAAARRGPELPITAVSVGDPAPILRHKVEALWDAGRVEVGGDAPRPRIDYRDDYVGAGYGLIDPDQAAVVEEATRLTGLLFDPTYTGKALFGLHQDIRAGRFEAGQNVVFWHTGGGFEALRAVDEGHGPAG